MRIGSLLAAVLAALSLSVLQFGYVVAADLNATEVAAALIQSVRDDPAQLASLKAQAAALLDTLDASNATTSTQSGRLASSFQPLRTALKNLGVTLPQDSALTSTNAAASGLRSILNTFLASFPLASSSLPGGGLLRNSAPASSLTPNVTASSGPASSGSAEDLLKSYKGQVAQLRKYYKEARDLLNTDDAVRIGGYLITLDSLGLQSVSAFVVAEGALLVSELSFLSAVLSTIGSALDVTQRSMGLATSIVALQLVVQSIFPSTTTTNKPPPSGRLSSGLRFDNATLLGVETLAFLANQDALLSQLIDATDVGLESERADFTSLNDSVGQLALARNLLTQALATADRIAAWQAQSDPTTDLESNIDTASVGGGFRGIQGLRTLADEVLIGPIIVMSPADGGNAVDLKSLAEAAQVAAGAKFAFSGL